MVSPGDAEYDDLIKQNARGVCHSDTGYIYIRDDIELTAHLLIHEFVHRLSRNCIDGKWILGIHHEEILYNINEAITELIAIDLTGAEEAGNYYIFGIDILRLLFDKTGTHNLISAYFTGDVELLNNTFKCKVSA